MTEEANFQKALAFLHDIGIPTIYRSLSADQCFLPGILIEAGQIIIDKEKLLYPGDILHEAAHLAVVPAADRRLLEGPSIGLRKDAAAEEMMAIAWSYAACVHLGIPPGFVFHEHGYQNGGEAIVKNFSEGNYFGVPMLQWLGMTSTEPGSDAIYPVMKNWLRS